MCVDMKAFKCETKITVFRFHEIVNKTVCWLEEMSSIFYARRNEITKNGEKQLSKTHVFDKSLDPMLFSVNQISSIEQIHLSAFVDQQFWHDTPI